MKKISEILEDFAKEFLTNNEWKQGLNGNLSFYKKGFQINVAGEKVMCWGLNSGLPVFTCTVEDLQNPLHYSFICNPQIYEG